MTTPLLERTFASTLAAVIAEFSARPGVRLDAWVYDDLHARRAAEGALMQAGVTARVRSAFKPLVHFFLEEAEPGFVRADVAYPVHPAAPANRFLIEAYPLAGLLKGVDLRFSAGSDEPLTYVVALGYADGTTRTHRVFAPNREHADAVAEPQLSPTGWLRIEEPDGTRADRPLVTDAEQIFTAAVAAAAEWPERAPEAPPEQLRLALHLPWPDQPLGFGDEAIRLAEALHEDLYFSLLEVFQTRSGLALGDRTLQPGQIAPVAVVAPGAARVRVSSRALDPADPEAPAVDLADPQEPPPPAQIAAALAEVGGVAFEARSAGGRPVWARHREGDDAAVMISGGQHANEPSGIVGALRAAQALAQRPEAHFTVAPLENPDGYALYRELIALSPGQMLHAARYTALGDDLEYRASAPRFESAIRDEALRRARPRFHVNLHGYPAHEWCRPFTGYVPRGFAQWMLPRGFFFIVRHHAAWSGAAERLIAAVTRRVGAALPEVLALTERQRAASAPHAGENGFRVVNGFCCQISVDDTLPTPLKLTTEYPDESLRGADFALACAAQTETVLAAYDAYQKIVG